MLIIQALKNVEIDSEAQERAIYKLMEIIQTQGIPLHMALNHILKETKTKAKM